MQKLQKNLDNPAAACYSRTRAKDRGEFPSGQRGQTVNLLLYASVVRIHPLPPEIGLAFASPFSVRSTLRVEEITFGDEIPCGDEIAAAMGGSKRLDLSRISAFVIILIRKAERNCELYAKDFR